MIYFGLIEKQQRVYSVEKLRKNYESQLIKVINSLLLRHSIIFGQRFMQNMLFH